MKTIALILVTIPLFGIAALETAAAQDTQTTTFKKATGDLIVRTGQPTPRDYGPPPPFAQLASSGDGYITLDEAAAYPPLANDFIHVDANRDGRISKSEYQRWAQSP